MCRFEILRIRDRDSGGDFPAKHLSRVVDEPAIVSSNSWSVRTEGVIWRRGSSSVARPGIPENLMRRDVLYRVLRARSRADSDSIKPTSV
jgi:hypothetical protein